MAPHRARQSLLETQNRTTTANVSVGAARRGGGAQTVYVRALAARPLRLPSGGPTVLCRAPGEGALFALQDGPSRPREKMRHRSWKRGRPIFKGTDRIQDPGRFERQTPPLLRKCRRWNEQVTHRRRIDRSSFSIKSPPIPVKESPRPTHLFAHTSPRDNG